MADRGFGPRQGMPGRLEDLDIRLPGHRVHGQDRAPGRAHDDYTRRQDEGHAFGFVRHTRHYDDKDWDKDRYAAGSPAFPRRIPPAASAALVPGATGAATPASARISATG